MDRRALVANITAVARTAKLYGLPIVVTIVNVKTGFNQPLIHQLVDILPGVEPIDRTPINAWEDDDFVAAVKAAGRLVFPALDALKAGYEVYPVVDAVAGTSAEAHRAGLERIVQAGAKPTSWVQLICELQRDWLRKETVPGFVDILFAVEGH
jgi:nicotinamidase-related amidase